MNEDIYGIKKWGNDILEILENGNIGLKNPFQPDNPPTDLIKIIKSLNERGISCPVLLRVTDYLAFRIKQINNSFFEAIKEIGYKGDYKGVFPVKVNQQAQVIDRIVEFGKEFDFGLEVGSKPELLIALAHDLSSNSTIICNGIKDREFIHLAILSLKIGFKTILVLESPRELDLIIEISKELNVRPLLGIRVKLTNKVSGNWSQSSGDRSAFGLSVEQVMEVINKLKNNNYLDCLILQHSHLGSQIPDIIEIRKATQEACRFFSEMIKQGAPLNYLDLGGGLGVDYTGEQKSAFNSINYSLDEYCTNIVETVKYELDQSKIDHPTIITESGRACIASSSMLIFNILETTNFDSKKIQTFNEERHSNARSSMQSYLDQLKGTLADERADRRQFELEMNRKFEMRVAAIEADNASQRSSTELYEKGMQRDANQAMNELTKLVKRYHQEAEEQKMRWERTYKQGLKQVHDGLDKLRKETTMSSETVENVLRAEIRMREKKMQEGNERAVARETVIDDRLQQRRRQVQTIM